MRNTFEVLDEGLGVLGEAAAVYAVDVTELVLEPAAVTEAQAAESLGLDYTRVMGMRTARRDRKMAQVTAQQAQLQHDADEAFETQRSAWLMQQETNNAAAIGISLLVGDDEATEVLLADRDALDYKNRLLNFTVGIAHYSHSDTAAGKQAAEFSARSVLSDIGGDEAVVLSAVLDTVLHEVRPESDVVEQIETRLARQLDFLQERHDRLFLSAFEIQSLLNTAATIRVAKDYGIDVREHVRILDEVIFRDAAQTTECLTAKPIRKLHTTLTMIEELTEEGLFADLYRQRFYSLGTAGPLRDYTQRADIIEQAKNTLIQIQNQYSGNIPEQARESVVEQFTAALTEGNADDLAELVSQLPQHLRMIGYFAIVATRPEEYRSDDQVPPRFPVQPIATTIQKVKAFDNIRRTTRDIEQSGGYAEWQQGQLAAEALKSLGSGTEEAYDRTPAQVRALARQAMRDDSTDDDATIVELQNIARML